MSLRQREAGVREGARADARRADQGQAGARGRRRGGGRRRRAHAVAELDHGAVVIAAITSCTNTSNPSVLLGAGPAREEGGREGARRQAVGEDQPRAGVAGRHRVPREVGPAAVPGGAGLPPRRLRLHDVHRQQRPAARGGVGRRAREATSSSAAVLSGNRNFEGRIQQEVRANYLASPPLVVAYALAGTMTTRSHDRAAGHRDRRAARLPARRLAERA